MTKNIFFYIPDSHFSAAWPKSLTDDWVGFGGGANVWVYFTAIALRNNDYAVQIVTKFPESGIVLSHSRYLPSYIEPRQDRLIICIRADYGRKYSADVHVVQNKFQVSNRGREFFEFLFFPGPNYYIPYWPQPGLIPRDPKRGDKFERVVFMGAPQNIHEDLLDQDWCEKLNREGIIFEKIFSRGLWHNYREVDAVLAIRPKNGDHHSRKPPSKLVNAWLSGVPAILGPDSAFKVIRNSPLDYIEVSNAEDAQRAILNLRDNPLLREKMVSHGCERGLEYSISQNVNRWMAFFNDFAIPLYQKRLKKNKIIFSFFAKIKRIRMAIKNGW